MPQGLMRWCPWRAHPPAAMSSAVKSASHISTLTQMADIRNHCCFSSRVAARKLFTLLSFRFRDPADEEAFERDEIEIVRSPLRVIFALMLAGFLLWQTSAGAAASVQRLIRDPDPPLIVRANAIYTLVTFIPMGLGLLAWFILIWLRNPRVSAYRHYAAAFMQSGLAVSNIPRWVYGHNYASMCIPGAELACFTAVTVSLLFYQMLFALFFPAVVRTSFNSHWPLAIFREVSMMVVYMDSWGDISSVSALAESGLIVSVVFEAVSLFVLFLNEGNARENFLLNKQLDQQRNLTMENLGFIMHEVRNPMNGVIGNAQLLEDSDLNEEQREYLTDVLASCLQMKTVIGDVLDLNKIHAGRMELECVEFRVESVINAAVAQIKSAALAKELALTASVSADVLPRFLGDPARITQMLSNYLTNACKFVPSRTGSIDVFVHSVAPTQLGRHRLRWVVRDNGMGLKEDEVPRLFQSYMQASASVARLHGGSGLGLTVVRELSDLMRGAAAPGTGVGVFSVFGQGSSFWFEIELMRAEGSGSEQSTISSNHGSGMSGSSGSRANSQLQLPPTTHAQAAMPSALGERTAAVDKSAGPHATTMPAPPASDVRKPLDSDPQFGTAPFPHMTRLTLPSPGFDVTAADPCVSEMSARAPQWPPHSPHARPSRPEGSASIPVVVMEDASAAEVTSELWERSDAQLAERARTAAEDYGLSTSSLARRVGALIESSRSQRTHRNSARSAGSGFSAAVSPTARAGVGSRSSGDSGGNLQRSPDRKMNAGTGNSSPAADALDGHSSGAQSMRSSGGESARDGATAEGSAVKLDHVAVAFGRSGAWKANGSGSRSTPPTAAAANVADTSELLHRVAASADDQDQCSAWTDLTAPAHGMPPVLGKGSSSRGSNASSKRSLQRSVTSSRRLAAVDVIVGASGAQAQHRMSWGVGAPLRASRASTSDSRDKTATIPSVNVANIGRLEERCATGVTGPRSSGASALTNVDSADGARQRSIAANQAAGGDSPTSSLQHLARSAAAMPGGMLSTGIPQPSYLVAQSQLLLQSGDDADTADQDGDVTVWRCMAWCTGVRKAAVDRKRKLVASRRPGRGITTLRAYHMRRALSDERRYFAELPMRYTWRLQRHDGQSNALAHYSIANGTVAAAFSVRPAPTEPISPSSAGIRSDVSVLLLARTRQEMLCRVDEAVCTPQRSGSSEGVLSSAHGRLHDAEHAGLQRASPTLGPVLPLPADAGASRSHSAPARRWGAGPGASGNMPGVRRGAAGTDLKAAEEIKQRRQAAPPRKAGTSSGSSTTSSSTTQPCGVPATRGESAPFASDAADSVPTLADVTPGSGAPLSGASSSRDTAPASVRSVPDAEHTSAGVDQAARMRAPSTSSAPAPGPSARRLAGPLLLEDGGATPHNTAGRGRASGAARSAEPTSRELHVMVVDDDAVQRQLLKRMLERWGCHVSEARDGREALRKLARIRDRGGWVDVMSLDINMSPGLGGVPTARCIRQLEVLSLERYLPIIAVTAGTQPHECRAYWEAGMDAIVAKPVDRAEFILCVEHFARQRRVLVVEDDPVNQRLMQHIIEREGHIVHVVGSGEAVQAIISDGQMLREGIRSDLSSDNTIAAASSPHLRAYLRKDMYAAVPGLKYAAGAVLPAIDEGAGIHARQPDAVMARGAAPVVAATTGSATGGHEAVLSFEGFDLVFIDLHLLPGCMDGVQTARLIRAQPGGADVPIIAMSAGIGQDEQARCIAAGMQSFLAKPLQRGDVAAAIRRWAGSW